MAENVLYYGDNLDILQRYVEDESVDLVYLDPPFKSNQDYNILFEEQDGSRAAAQIAAFQDTWCWDQRSAAVYEQVVRDGGRLSETMQALHRLLGGSDMLAYLSMMAPRLHELHRVLKPTGSIYLHCDPAASHYLKILLDAIFQPKNYLNDVIWQRTSAHNDPNKYGRIHDVLLFYGKSPRRTWNQQYDAPGENFYKSHDFERDEKGRLYRKRDLTAPAHGRTTGRFEWNGKIPPPGRMWSYTEANMRALESEERIVYTKTGMPRLKIYADKLQGVPYQDVWAMPDLWLNSAAKERIGYPTQKPESLLERLIQSSSNEGDVVLDPFCGCGTAIAVAHKLHRRWAGIDITNLAIALIRHRLQQAFGSSVRASYQVIGEPMSLPDARALAVDDRFQFQWWALGLIDARPVPTEQKRGADRGIDGRIHFIDPTRKAQQILCSVKSGKVSVRDVRDIAGVLHREKAVMGILVTLEEPTAPMIREAADAGVYMSPWAGVSLPRLQICTVESLLVGERPALPPSVFETTYKPFIRHGHGDAPLLLEDECPNLINFQVP